MDLFTRTGGNIRLTDAGKVYLEIGRKIFNLENQLEHQMIDISKCRSGSISIGISQHRAMALMPSIVAAFRRQYPGIILNIIEKKRSEILEAAEHGDFDLCLTTLPVNQNRFEASHVLFEENVLAVPTPTNMVGVLIENRRFPAVSVQELSQLPFVMLNPEHPMQQELDELCGEYGLTLRKVVECSSLETLIEMVNAGVGAAFIPSCLAKPLSNICYFSILEKSSIREIVLLVGKEQYLSQAAKDLKQIVIDLLNDVQ